MHLVEIDVIDFEPPKAVVTRRLDPSPGQTGTIRVTTHRIADLRGKHHPVALADEGRAEDLLRVPIVVHVCSVEERYPRVESTVDHPMALADVGVPPTSEHHGAERDFAHERPAVAQGALGDDHSNTTVSDMARTVLAPHVSAWRRPRRRSVRGGGHVVDQCVAEATSSLTSRP